MYLIRTRRCLFFFFNCYPDSDISLGSDTYESCLDGSMKFFITNVNLLFCSENLKCFFFSPPRPAPTLSGQHWQSYNTIPVWEGRSAEGHGGVWLLVWERQHALRPGSLSFWEQEGVWGKFSCRLHRWRNWPDQRMVSWMHAWVGEKRDIHSYVDWKCIDSCTKWLMQFKFSSGY